MKVAIYLFTLMYCVSLNSAAFCIAPLFRRFQTSTSTTRATDAELWAGFFSIRILLLKTDSDWIRIGFYETGYWIRIPKNCDPYISDELYHDPFHLLREAFHRFWTAGLDPDVEFTLKGFFYWNMKNEHDFSQIFKDSEFEIYQLEPDGFEFRKLRIRSSLTHSEISCSHFKMSQDCDVIKTS